MVMTKEEASNKLLNLIKYFGIAFDDEIPVVEVPLDKSDVLALQIAIHSIASLSKLSEVLYDTSLCAEEKEDRLICMLSRPVVDLDLKKEGEPDAH